MIINYIYIALSTTFVSTWNLLFGQLIPQFRKSNFPPDLSINYTRPWWEAHWPPPPPHTHTHIQLHTSCLWLMIDSTGTLEQFIMLLHNTTVLFSLCLALWPSESGVSKIVAWGGGGGRKLLKSNLKWGTIPHSCFKVWGILSNKRSSFVMILYLEWNIKMNIVCYCWQVLGKYNAMSQNCA